MSGSTARASLASKGDAHRKAARSALYVAPPDERPPLRVVLLAPREVPTWMLGFFELATASAWVDLAILPAADAHAPRVSGVPADVRGYLALERFRHRNRNTGSMLVSRDIAADDAVGCAPGLSAGVRIADICMAVQALRPDLILLLGAPAWGDALADCAAFGCWMLDAGLVDSRYAGLGLLGPMASGWDATELDLELVHPDGSADRLDNSWGATRADSFELQRDEAFRKLPALLMRALRKLASGEAPPRTRHVAGLRLAAPVPGPGAGLRALGVIVRRYVRRRLYATRAPEPWKLALRRAATPIDPAVPAADSSVIVAAPRGHFWADPCVVDDGGRQLLFVEEFPAPMGKGIIVCLVVNADDSVERLGTVLEEAQHLSYPQVFRWQERWHMTVESGAAKRTSLYRADEFPLRWTRISDLIVDRVCVDPTLYEHDGRWYLFANVSESSGSTCDELFLFVADSPMGPFLPHPANPIVSDVRRARPAGRLFRRGERLIRPAQNCGPSYGAEIVFNEVIELNPSRFAERSIGRLQPWRHGHDGCHTYSAIEGLEVFDVRDRAHAAG